MAPVSRAVVLRAPRAPALAAVIRAGRAVAARRGLRGAEPVRTAAHRVVPARGAPGRGAPGQGVQDTTTAGRALEEAPGVAAPRAVTRRPGVPRVAARRPAAPEGEGSRPAAPNAEAPNAVVLRPVALGTAGTTAATATTTVATMTVARVGRGRGALGVPPPVSPEPDSGGAGAWRHRTLAGRALEEPAGPVGARRDRGRLAKASRERPARAARAARAARGRLPPGASERRSGTAGTRRVLRPRRRRASARR